MRGVKPQQRLGIDVFEFFVNPFLPALGQEGLGVQVFGEKAVFVRNSQKIQHRDNHVQVADQHGLGEVLRKFLVPFRKPCPQPRGRFL